MDAVNPRSAAPSTRAPVRLASGVQVFRVFATGTAHHTQLLGLTTPPTNIVTFSNNPRACMQ
jgi:hypothetical protein